MVRRWLLLPMLAGMLIFVSMNEPGAAQGRPPKDKKDKKGEDKAGKDLNKAYDTLNEVSQAQAAAREKLPRDLARLLEQGQDFYRRGRRCYEDNDTFRAGEFAKAANDGGRGLRHWQRANSTATSGIPAPPPDLGPKGPPRTGGPAEPWEGARRNCSERGTVSPRWNR